MDLVYNLLAGAANRHMNISFDNNRKTIRRRYTLVKEKSRKKLFTSSNPGNTPITLQELSDSERAQINSESKFNFRIQNRTKIISLINLGTIVFTFLIWIFVTSSIQEAEFVSAQKKIKILDKDSLRAQKFYQSNWEEAMACEVNGELGKAQYLLERLYDEFPNDTLVMHKLSRIYLLRCMQEEKACRLALTTLNEIIRNNPNNEEFINYRSKIIARNSKLRPLRD